MRTFPRSLLARLLAVAVVTLGLTPALQGHAWACSCVVVHDGPAPTDRRRLRTAANGGLCGSRLDVGKPVLVVDDGHGRLSSCGDLTTQEHVARRASSVRAALRGPTMPRTGGPDATALWPLLVAAGLVAGRRRRAARA